MTEPREQADAAAIDARVDVRYAATLTDYTEVCRLLDETWGRGAGTDPSFIQAIAHAGNTVLVAERGGIVVGTVVGVLGWEDGFHVHSHVAAVTPSARGGVGFALKLAQRSLALENGVGEIRWTFDPLVRRNAHLNLEKLGARVRAYLPDFYGRLDDTINGADSSDRFEVSWQLAAPEVSDAVARALDRVGPLSAFPKEPEVEHEHDHGIRFELHPDYEAFRRDDPDAAAEFRAASRAVFEPAFKAGLTVEFLHGGYVFV